MHVVRMTNQKYMYTCSDIFIVAVVRFATSVYIVHCTAHIMH